MPKRVAELESRPEERASFLRGKLIEFLKKNSELAYTLNELYEHFLKQDKISTKYQKNSKILYHLIYGYLREFKQKKLVVHSGNYYYYRGKK